MPNKDYFVFDGQYASKGTANKITGRMSFYGSFLKFKTKKEAVEYVEKYETGNAGDILIAGTRNTLRRYDLGSSWLDYNFDLDQMDYVVDYDTEY